MFPLGVGCTGRLGAAVRTRAPAFACHDEQIIALNGERSRIPLRRNQTRWLAARTKVVAAHVKHFDRIRRCAGHKQPFAVAAHSESVGIASGVLLPWQQGGQIPQHFARRRVNDRNSIGVRERHEQALLIRA